MDRAEVLPVAPQTVSRASAASWRAGGELGEGGRRQLREHDREAGTRAQGYDESF